MMIIKFFKILLISKIYLLMETVIINADITENKKSEFFQVMESLKNLVKRYCTDIKISVSNEDFVEIRIVFKDKEELDKNFNNKEFNILKGSVRSLCNNVNIRIKELS